MCRAGRRSDAPGSRPGASGGKEKVHACRKATNRLTGQPENADRGRELSRCDDLARGAVAGCVGRSGSVWRLHFEVRLAHHTRASIRPHRLAALQCVMCADFASYPRQVDARQDTRHYRCTPAVNTKVLVGNYYLTIATERAAGFREDFLGFGIRTKSRHRTRELSRKRDPSVLATGQVPDQNHSNRNSRYSLQTRVNAPEVAFRRIESQQLLGRSGHCTPTE